MKAVVLARVSSREQEEGKSIDAQLENLNKYCQRNDLEVLKTYQLTESSTRGDRKKFVEMLSFVKAQRDKIAVVADCVDRIQRSFKESVELDELRGSDRIEIHFIREGLRLRKDSKASEIAMWDIGVFAAKTYVGSLRDNVKRSMDYNTSRGVWQSRAPMGYLNRRDEHNQPIIIFDPVRAAPIKELFESYATGLYSIGDLAVKAKELGLKSLLSNAPLQVSTLHIMLQNPFYYGVMRVKGQIIPHIYEPLISKTIFDKCQDVMHGRNHKKFKYAEKPHIFRGLVKCATCGCTITSDKKIKPNGKSYTYLFCSHFKGNCCQRAVNERLITQQLENEVFAKLAVLPGILGEFRARLQDSIGARNAFAVSETNRLNKLFDKNADKKSKLLDLLLAESISQDNYAAKLAEIDAEQEKIKAQLENHKTTDKSFELTLEYLINMAIRAPELFKSSKVEQKRALINILLSNCELDGEKLLFSAREPFNLLLKMTSHTDWLAHTDSNCDKENQNLLSYH